MKRIFPRPETHLGRQNELPDNHFGQPIHEWVALGKNFRFRRARFCAAGAISGAEGDHQASRDWFSHSEQSDRFPVATWRPPPVLEGARRRCLREGARRHYMSWTGWLRWVRYQLLPRRVPVEAISQNPLDPRPFGR